MKGYRFLVSVLPLVLMACSENSQESADVTTTELPSAKMTEEWCEQMMVKTNKEWVEQEIQLFGRDCTYADEE